MEDFDNIRKKMLNYPSPLNLEEEWEELLLKKENIALQKKLRITKIVLLLSLVVFFTIGGISFFNFSQFNNQVDNLPKNEVNSTNHKAITQSNNIPQLDTSCYSNTEETRSLAQGITTRNDEQQALNLSSSNKTLKREFSSIGGNESKMPTKEGKTTNDIQSFQGKKDKNWLYQDKMPKVSPHNEQENLLDLSLSQQLPKSKPEALFLPRRKFKIIHLDTTEILDISKHRFIKRRK